MLGLSIWGKVGVEATCETLPCHVQLGPVLQTLLMVMFALHRYTPEQLYCVVANVDQYQQFVPWCTKSRTFKGQSGDFHAELEIGFPPVLERYTSEVTVIPNHKVKVSPWKITIKHHSLIILFSREWWSVRNLVAFRSSL